MSIVAAEAQLLTCLASGSQPDPEGIEELIASILSAHGTHRARALDGFVLERQIEGLNELRLFGFGILVDDQSVEPVVLHLLVNERTIGDGSSLMFGENSADRAPYGSAAHGRMFKRLHADPPSIQWQLHFVRAAGVWKIAQNVA
ncbi:hypothetical protein ASE35_05720 [Lysobacter sp. Root916]|uniref:hypothetical protein n=1 Tax=Lysobacter sp. Root916 TaxID=1736606 RepID=UPI00070A6D87|nr:hypothetical protein [Lysobacter sp. Root916]KRD39819.1 hypothetical protein ASE35_05720 [Lysobacter sp. Root916]